MGIVLFIIFTKHQQLCTFAILLWVEPKLKSELWNARMELATELGSLQHGMAGNCFFNLFIFLLFIFLLACADHGYYLDDCNYFHHYWNYFRGWRSLLSICGINNNRRTNDRRTNNYSRRNNYNNYNNNYNNYNNYNNNNGRNNNDNICYRRWWYFRKWQCRITPTYQALSSSFKV